MKQPPERLRFKPRGPLRIQPPSSHALPPAQLRRDRGVWLRPGQGREGRGPPPRDTNRPLAFPAARRQAQSLTPPGEEGERGPLKLLGSSLGEEGEPSSFHSPAPRNHHCVGFEVTLSQSEAGVHPMEADE